MNSYKKIAICGGIGSGKSAVLKMLQTEGYYTVSCDEITAELYKKRKTLKGIKKLFPNTVSGVIRLKADKKSIAEEVFSDKDKLDKLNAYLQPLILEEVNKRCKGKTAFVEVPLLFEGNYQKEFDGAIVILRNKDERITSVLNRQGATLEQTLKRMEAQIDYDNFDFSDYTVIINDKGKEELKEKILSAIKKLTD